MNDIPAWKFGLAGLFIALFSASPLMLLALIVGDKCR